MTLSLLEVAYETLGKEASWPVLPIIMADLATGEIIYTSKFAATIFGYTPSELLGEQLEILLPEKLRQVHIAWRRDFVAPETRLLGVGRVVHGQKKDGTIFPLHVGFTTAKADENKIGVAFVVDLTGICGKQITVEQTAQVEPLENQEEASPVNLPSLGESHEV